MEVYGDAVGDSDGSGPGESQLREDLADAMLESPGIHIRDTGELLTSQHLQLEVCSSQN